MNFRSYSVHVNHVWHRHNYVWHWTQNDYTFKVLIYTYMIIRLFLEELIRHLIYEYDHGKQDPVLTDIKKKHGASGPDLAKGMLWNHSDFFFIAQFWKYICKVSHWIWDIGDKPEHDPINNNNFIYIFRNIKTLNYVLFLLCVCLIYQSWMFVSLMMPHEGPMIRQYNIYYILYQTNKEHIFCTHFIKMYTECNEHHLN